MSSYEVHFSVWISSMKLSSQYTDILLRKSTEKETDNKIAGEKTRENVENVCVSLVILSGSWQSKIFWKK